MKKFSRHFATKNYQYLFIFSRSLVNYFWQFHALGDNQASDVVALPKINQTIEIGGNRGQS